MKLRSAYDVSFRGKNHWKNCFSRRWFDGTNLFVYYGNPNDCRPCTSPPDLAAKKIGELTAKDVCDGCKLKDFFHEVKIKNKFGPAN